MVYAGRRGEHLCLYTAQLKTPTADLHPHPKKSNTHPPTRPHTQNAFLRHSNMLPNAQETTITTVLVQAQVGGKGDKGLLMHGYPRKRERKSHRQSINHLEEAGFSEMIETE